MGGGGKGGSTKTESSNQGASVTQIPAWLDAAAQGAVGTAQNLSQRPYTPYTGEMVAGTTPDTQQAYQQIRDLQGQANPIYDASQQAYQGMLGSVNPLTTGQVNQNTNALYGNYAQNVMAPTAGLFGQYLQNASPATAQQVGSNAMTLMSPYEQAVINPALQAGQQQLALGLQNVATQANNVGAFGGTRQGVTEGVAQAQAALGTGQQIGNLLNQGWQANITPAYNLANQQSQQGYNAASLLAGQAGTGYSNAATQGGNIASTNLSTGMTAAQQATALATAQQQQAATEAGYLQNIGSAQQQQQQALDAAKMGQFYEQQDWPVQNLDVLLSAIGGVPYGTNTATVGQGTSTTTKSPGLLDYITAIAGTGAKVAGAF